MASSEVSVKGGNARGESFSSSICSEPNRGMILSWSSKMRTMVRRRHCCRLSLSENILERPELKEREHLKAGCHRPGREHPRGLAVRGWPQPDRLQHDGQIRQRHLDGHTPRVQHRGPTQECAPELVPGGNQIRDHDNGLPEGPRRETDRGLVQGYSNAEVTVVARGAVNCSQVNAITSEQLNYPSIAVNFGGSNTKTVKRTVTNVGDPNSAYTAEFDEPKGVNIDVSPSTLQFTRAGEELSFNVTLNVKVALSQPPVGMWKGSSLGFPGNTL